MVTQKTKLIAVLVMTAFAMLLPLMLSADIPPPANRTGAPGSSTCTSCHSQTALGSGNVTITFANGNTYTPGTAKRLTVTVNNTLARRWSFELTARQASSTSTGAGTFANVNSTTTILSSGGIQYPAASTTGTFQNQANSATWQVDWTPPASSVGNVIFYIAALAANNNGGTSGDATYTANYTLTPAAATPTMSVSPASLSFSYIQNGTTPASQAVSVASSGTAFSYTVATSATWLTASATTGTTPGTVNISVNPSGLAPGSYSGNVTVSSTGASNSPQTVPVTLTVTAAPTLTASPATLTFSAIAGGGAPAAQSVSVSSSGAALSYTVSDNATWLSVTPTSGTTPGTLSVTASQTGLTAGTYTGTITVTASGASNSPQTVAVTLNVAAPALALSPGTLSFSAQSGGATPAAQSVAVSSNGSALSYTVSDSAAWLTVTPATGTTPSSLSVSVSQAGLAAGTYTGTITVTATGASNSPQSVAVTLTVTSSPVLTLSPGTLSYSYQIGGATPAAQTINVTSSGAALSYTVSDNAAWLTTSAASGTTPGSFSATVNPAGLAAGTYNGSITVTASGASNSPQTVAVTLTVAAAPTLTVAPATLSYSYQIGGSTPAAQSVNVTSSGSALSYTVTDSATWLTVAPTTGTTPGSLSATVNPSGLAAGTYSGTITVTASGASNSPQTVSVTLTVTPAPTLTLAPATLAYSYQLGGAAPAAQTVNVTSSGPALSYTVSDSATWLSVTPASGTTPGSVSAAVSPSGLAAGTYTGTITVTASGASNSPQTVAVTLTVTNAPVNLSVTPSALSFAYSSGGTVPAAQTVSVASSGAALSYTTSTSAAWLLASPASGSTPGSVSVSVNPTGLAVGSYNGNVTIASSGASNSPQTVNVTLMVTSSTTPMLTSSPASLSFAYEMGGAYPAGQRINISSSGSNMGFRGTTDQPWLMIVWGESPTPGYLDIQVNPDGLDSGTYSGNVWIHGGGPGSVPTAVPVSMTVAANGQTLLSVSPGALSFSGQAGGASPAAQTVSITSNGALNWTRTSSAAWLTATPTSGSTPGTMAVSANTAGMAAGTYNGTITVTGTGATNGPQVVAVTLVVTSATPTATLGAMPKALAFYYRPGDAAPSAQSLTVTSSSGTLSYTAASHGGAWLAVSPSGGSTPGSLNVSVAPSGMTAGSYSGNVAITTGSGTPVTVPVTLIVSSAQTTPSGTRIDPVPYTYDPTGTAGVSAGWISGAGVADTADSANQALVLIKNGASSTDSQAGIRIQGAAGLGLTELGFDIRSGQCTSSGPHFAVITSDNVAHVLVCLDGTVQPAPAAGWTRVRFNLGQALPPITAGQQVNSLDLVLSAGPDSGSGFAVVDNVNLNGKLIGKP